MSSRVRLAVVGAGIMGANHARVARQLPDVELVAVVDRDTERARVAAAAVGARAAERVAEVADEVDGVVIAVPTALHHEIAAPLLDAGIAVLVEKPIASSLDAAADLVARADRTGAVLAVGHIERFNAAVAELPRLLDDPVHLRVERINPYSPRILDGVVLDLMIHDLDIVASLAGEDATVTDLAGVARCIRSESEDLAAVTLAFDTGLTAGLTTSRLGQQKIRQIEVTQRDSVVVADLLRQDITIHRMSRHEYLSDQGTRYRQSSVVEIPFLETRGEPLALELAHFVACVRGEDTPRVDGRAGRRALELALTVLERVAGPTPVSAPAGGE